MKVCSVVARSGGLAKTLAILGLSLVTYGCAPATLQGLRENPSGRSKIEVAQNYQNVYRRVLTNARKCWQTGMITAQMVVTGDLYTDLKTGEISVALHGGLGVDTYLGIEMKAIDAERTEVQIYNALATWERSAKLVQQWVVGEHSECELRKEGA